MAAVVPVANARERDEALALRMAVLVGEQGLRESAVIDEIDLDPTTLHCIVRDANGVCVGAGRLAAPVDVEADGRLIAGNPTIGPVVVAPSARRGGIPGAIIAYLETEALALFGNNGSVSVEAWVPRDAGHAIRDLAAS